jgi:putative ABC transport system permease protein
MLDRKLLRDLGRMKGQVATIAVVIACGVAVIIAALSTHESLQWSQRHYYETARFAQIFARLKRAPAPLVQRLRAIPGVAEVETRLVHDVTLDAPGHSAPVVGRMISVPEHGQPELNRLHLRRGRLLEPGRVNKVIVSEGFALANGLNPGDRISALFNGHRETLHIVGVALSAEYIFAVRGGEVLPDDRQFGVFWIGYDGLAAAFDMDGAFNDVVLTIAPHASEQAVIDELDRLLAPYGGLGAYGRDQQVSHRFVSDEIKQQESMATTMPPVFLAVAAFLLNIVLGRVIAAQREQIAALKAIGYENWAIGWHYLKMVCVIVLLGGVLGVALGAWFGKLMTANYVSFFRFPVLSFRMSPHLAVLAVGVSLASAIVAALSTVRRVVALAPAEAMRPPAPPVYHRTWIERIGPFQRLSPQGSMVLRNIVRRPGRALLTILGLALAAPILVLALFWQDAIDYMMTVQFSAIERGDATVTFTEPVTTRAGREIAHFPGVLQVEGVRFVPARLRAGHRSYRTAVSGLPRQGELRRLLDEHLREIPLPPDGLLLSDRLGERLGVGPGDRVIVEVLEGARRRHEVIVVALVNDVMGMSAYMNVTALNRLLLEGDVISAVSVSFMHNQTDEVYARLKQLPKVATVNIKQSALKSFMETTAKFVLVFTGVLTIFAAAIAVGVVYNNARVALAERAWELASLRVLGFTRSEVSTMLLGELALELLIAIPLGLWLGYWFVVALAQRHQTEMFRIPAVVAPRTYAFAALIILVSGIISALIVRHRVDHLDLVSVLKTKE